MLITSNAIVFKKINYSENSIIVQLFTQKRGLQSYIVRNTGKSKKNNVSRLFQPLALLEIVAYTNDKSGLKNLKEARLFHPYQSIYQDIMKQSMVVFLNEILLKAIKEEEVNDSLFEFLSESLKLFDRIELGVANFHLIFLMKMTSYLGFKASQKKNGQDVYFDLREGVFIPSKPLHTEYIEGNGAELWHKLQFVSWREIEGFKLNNPQRRFLIQTLLAYYAIHIDRFGSLKSIDVLKEVLS